MIDATIYIELVIYSDLAIDFDRIENIIGVPPSRCATKGDTIRQNHYFKNSFWRYSTPKLDTLNLEDVIDIIVSVIEPKLDELSSYLKENNLDCKLCVVAECNAESFPAFVIPLELVKICSALNAWIDFDIYFCD